MKKELIRGDESKKVMQVLNEQYTFTWMCLGAWNKRERDACAPCVPQQKKRKTVRKAPFCGLAKPEIWA